MTEFTDAMLEAVSEYRRMRREGVSREDAQQGLALVIRDHWPKGREEPWRYYCDVCQDTGLRTVQKPSVVYGGADVPWKEPCQCLKGQTWHENHRPKGEADA